MIVSHENKLIFVKTRKTAGTSIEFALSQFCGDRDIISRVFRGDERRRQELGYRPAQNHHLPLREYTVGDWARLVMKGKRGRYRSHTPAARLRSQLGEKTWNSYFKFCFERNPWDKAISLYYWRYRDRESPLPLVQFLRSVQPYLLSNYEMYTIDGSVAVDHVALYENFEVELEGIRERLQLSEAIELPQMKADFRKDRRNYADVLGSEERAIIEKVCAREIALFGYAF